MDNKLFPSYSLQCEGGRSVKLYYIAEVARRLKRHRMTIIRWERQGIIPDSGFRSPENYRLYTAQQIYAIERFLERSGLRQGRQQIPGYAMQLTEEMKELANEYRKLCGRIVADEKV